MRTEHTDEELMVAISFEVESREHADQSTICPKILSYETKHHDRVTLRSTRKQAGTATFFIGQFLSLSESG